MRGDGVHRRDGRKGYYLSWVDAEGKRHRRKAKGFLLGEARAELEKKHTRTTQAVILGYAPPSEDSFREVVGRYLEYQKPRLTVREYERQRLIVNKHLDPFFSGKIKEIRRANVQRYITKRSGMVSAATVRKEVNVLKHMLNLAVFDWEIITFNPAQGVKSPKVAPGRVRYLQPTELRLLMSACLEWLRPIVALAVTTGMRRSEILRLRWLDMDIAHQRLLLPQTKNNEGKVVYLNQSALAALRSLPFGAQTKSVDLLFPDLTPEKVSVAFHRTCNKVGIADFRFHDLRHTAASWLRMSGADIHTVGQILGHKDIRMAARYQHLSPEFLAKAVRRLDRILGLESPLGVSKSDALVGAGGVTA